MSSETYHEVTERTFAGDNPRVERTESWYKDGKLHREDGPAVIFPSGTQDWYLNGERHREDGPAVIRKNGTQEWWLNGVCQKVSR
jgi:hypothetical protein